MWSVCETQDFVANDIIPRPDSELGIEFPESGNWDVSVWAIFLTSLNCDVTTLWTAPASLSTMIRGCVASTGTAAAFTSRTDTAGNVRASLLTTVITYQLGATSTRQLVYERAMLVGVVAGDVVRFSWAQASTTPGNLLRDRFSVMKAVKV